MKVKRMYLFTVLFMVLSLLLASCGGAAPTTTATEAVSEGEAPSQAGEQPAEESAEQPAGESQAGSAEPVKIVYWRALTGPPGDIQDELAARFNESQDQVEVEVQFQGTYEEILQKLQAAMIAGQTPDLVQLDSPFVALFAKDGALRPLDEFASDPEVGIDLEDFVPGFLADGYYQGKLYSLPFMRSTPLLYYNADMFAEAGLPDRGPETWDEFIEFSEKLTKVEGDRPVQQGVSFTMGATTAHWYLQALIYSYGGLVSDEDFNMHLSEPEAIQAAKLWQDMVFESGIGKAGIDEGGSQGDFLNHRVGMVFGSTGSMTNLMTNADFTVGAAMIPAGVRREVPVGGSVIAMTSNDAERQLAAWKFMTYLTQPENIAEIVIATGYLPITQSAMEHPDLVAFYEEFPERKVAMDQLQYARPQASVISLATGTELLRQAVEKLLVGNVPVEQVMQEAEEALRLEYEQNFK